MAFFYRPLNPNRLRKFLQKRMVDSAGLGLLASPNSAREELLSAIDIHSHKDREEYVDIFIREVFGELNQAAAYVVIRWLHWDDVKEKFLDADTNKPVQWMAKQELLKYIGTVLKHKHKDIRYLDFPA